MSSVVKGIEHAVNLAAQNKSARKAVANLSLGARFNLVLNSAVDAAVDSGLPMIVAAGNGNHAACATSPASAKKAFVVGAIDDRYDSVASFSNWGSCVNMFAPGVYVTSLSHENNDSISLSGTSMASPAVAGTIAIFMGLGDDVYTAMTKLSSIATVNAISMKHLCLRPLTPNKIVYNGQLFTNNSISW